MLIAALTSVTWKIFAPAKNDDSSLSKKEVVPSEDLADFYRVYLNAPATPLAVNVLSNPSAPFQKRPSHLDVIEASFNPTFLQKYEGSYTVDEFRSQNTHTGFSLNSSWLLWNSSLPQMKVTLRKNFASGEYELVGGKLFLPTKGMGISYEDDKDTGESRAYFDVKKDF